MRWYGRMKMPFPGSFCCVDPLPARFGKSSPDDLSSTDFSRAIIAWGHAAPIQPIRPWKHATAFSSTCASRPICTRSPFFNRIYRSTDQRSRQTFRDSIIACLLLILEAPGENDEYRAIEYRPPDR
jgi:hypothetical protein